MIWILVAVVLIAGSVALAHRALLEWWPDNRPAISTALVYAAGVVVGAQVSNVVAVIATENDTTFGQFHDNDLMLRADVQTAVSALGDIAWQAGLLVALAVLVAWASARRQPA